MKFSVCIDAVYRDINVGDKGNNIYDSMAQIKELGFDAFEFWSWWDKDIELLKTNMQKYSLKLECFCTKMVSLTEESLSDEYLKGLQESIEVAKYLGCNKLITQVGNDLGIDRNIQQASIICTLKKASKMLKENGITLLVEPLNTKVDHVGYYLSSSQEGFEIIEKIGSENVKLLFDIYHQQLMEGDILSSVRRGIEYIGHFHCAGTDGRHEIDRGELNYNYIFNEIDKLNYKGYMGLEYFPINEPIIGLSGLKPQERLAD